MNSKSIAVGVYKNPTIQKYLKEGVLTSSQINKLIVEQVLEEAPADSVRRWFGDQMRATPDDDPKAKLAKAEEILTAMAKAVAADDISKLFPAVAKENNPEKVQAYIAGLKQVFKSQAPNGDSRSKANQLRAAISAAESTEEKVGLLAAVAAEGGGDEEAAKKTIAAVGGDANNEKLVGAVVNAAGGDPVPTAEGGMTEEEALKLVTDVLIEKGKGVPTDKRTDEKMEEILIPEDWVPELLGEAFQSFVGARTGELEPFFAIVLKAWQEATPGEEEEAPGSTAEKPEGLPEVGETYHSIHDSRPAKITKVYPPQSEEIPQEERQNLSWGVDGNWIIQLNDGGGTDFRNSWPEPFQQDWEKREAPEEAPSELDTSAAEAKYGEALKAFGDNYDLLLKLTAALMGKPQQLQEGGYIQLGKALKGSEYKGHKEIRLKDVLEKFFSKEERNQINKLFSDPEMAKRYMKIFATTKKEDPTNVEDAFDEVVDIWTANDGDTKLEEFRRRFLEVPKLSQQSKIFKDLWNLVRKMAGVFKSAAEQEQASFTDKVPANEAVEPNPEDKYRDEVEGEGQEFKEKVVDSARVLQRHTDRINDVLTVYAGIVGSSEGGDAKKLTVGNNELMKRYGDQNPKRLLYSLMRLLLKDINNVIAHIDAMLKKPEKQITEQEAPEMDRAEKIVMVKNMHSAVGSLGQELQQLMRDITKMTAQTGNPIPTNEEEEVAPVPETAPDDTGARPEDKETATTGKELATQMYKLMQPVKEFFPTANPLKTEHAMEEAVKAFQEVIKDLGPITAHIIRFKKEQNLPESMLTEYKGKIEAIKNILIEIFGVKDMGGGKVGTPDNSQSAAISDAGDDSGLSPEGGEVKPVKGDEKDEEAEDPAGAVMKTPKDLYLFLRKKASIFSRFFKELKINDEANHSIESIDYNTYVSTFAKFWTYLTHFKAQEGPKEITEKRWMNSLHVVALGMKGSESDKFMKLINTKDPSFGKSMEWFLHKFTKPGQKTPRVDIMKQLFKKAMVQWTEEELGYTLDPEFSKQNMLFQADTGDAPIEEPPDEEPPDEEPTPEESWKAPDKETPPGEEEIPDPTSRTGATFEEELTKKLKPIIETQLKRKING